jgi:ubiquinone/menaquinone biosynthesis C-methylase UbiE
MHDNDVARYWDGNAEVWAKHVRAGYDTWRELVNNPALFELAGDLSGLNVLDAGCGDGHNTRKFARQGARMTGSDLSSKMIELARAEEEREPLGIRYEVGSFSDQTLWDDESFDAVVSTMALMDCVDYEGAIRQFHRVLRPNGLLVFNICHPCFSNNILGWESDSEGEVVGIRLGDYFSKGHYTEQWSFNSAPDSEKAEPFTVIYFLRTLSDYINPLCGNGFMMEAIVEPQPSEEACQICPRWRKHRLIPHSLCIRARKR